MANIKRDLFIGVTAWNSRHFIGPCLDQIARTAPPGTRVMVVDNMSTDGTDDIAAGRSVDVMRLECNQPAALNTLLARSDGRHTLLIHSDVLLLNPQWFAICLRQFTDGVALLSPEDIGCGPGTRPWGFGMPESSFLLFDTAMARACRHLIRVQRFKIKWPQRRLDFFGPHITYNLPKRLSAKGFGWRMMQVHTSVPVTESFYQPPFVPKYWDDGLGLLPYGLGNFYSLDGEVTHFHNWFDRVGLGDGEFDPLSQETIPPQGGFPKAYLQITARHVLDDLVGGGLSIPDLAADGARVALSGYDELQS